MSLSMRLLAAVLCAIGLVGGGYHWGSTATDNAWEAKQAKTEREARQKYDVEVKRGDEAVAALIAERDEATTHYRQFERDFNELRKRSPLVVPSAGAVCAEAGDGAGPAAGGLENRVDPAGPVLTAGALWMWNTALAGTDQPAGACGSADTSTAACAAVTGVTLDVAWVNHTENAQLCAEDRLNHQRLIDYLKARP